MPSRVSVTSDLHRELLTAGDSLDWLEPPGTVDRDVGPKFAEYEQHGLTEYRILEPETLAHRFYRRDGELLGEYGEETIDSAPIPGTDMKPKRRDV